MREPLLTESQVAALERKREEQMECGEIETAHPGYFGSQDTFYVGNMNGVGRIYQQTFVDLLKGGSRKAVHGEDPADRRGFAERSGVAALRSPRRGAALRVLTDRGTEYCGPVEQHEFQLYFAVNDIDHTRTKAQSPQTNGICGRQPEPF